MKLEHLEKQQATERENFRLQLENLILRTQRGLPPMANKPQDEPEE